MDKRISLQRPQTIHFRRWSRKAYAVFGSLGKCVVIGNLKKEVTDASLEKQLNTCTLLTARRPKTEDDECEDIITDNDTILLEILQWGSCTQSLYAEIGGELLFFFLSLNFEPEGCVMHLPGFFVSFKN